MSIFILSSLLALTDPYPVLENNKKPEAIVLNQDLIAERMGEAREIIGALSYQDESVEKVVDQFLIELDHLYQEGSFAEKDVHRILDAAVFSADKHQFQTRKNPEQTPYIIHPVGVAYNLLTLGQVRDADVILGGLLHDTVEDTNTSFEEISLFFGDRVAGFVEEVTDDKSLPKEERKRLQIVNASHKSEGAAQIKLADKLYNLSDLAKNPPTDWPQERIDAYFQWAKQVVDGLPLVSPALKEAVDAAIASHAN